MKVVPDGFGGIAGDNGGQGLGGGLLRVAEAAEVSEQAPAGLGPTPGMVSSSESRFRMARRWRRLPTAKRRLSRRKNGKTIRCGTEQ